VHPHEDPSEALAAVVERTVRRGGTVVVPAFAVGRAQELLYFVWKLKQAGRLKNVPVYVDSPMAINASELYLRHAGDHRIDKATCEQIGALATYVRDVEESKKLSSDPYPKIIISASGMATGGAYCITSPRSARTTATRCCSPASRPPVRADATCWKAHAR
jgi:metallo-beta-lactamase family protein